MDLQGKYRKEGEKMAELYRALQQEVAELDKEAKEKKKDNPVQAGARNYPASPVAKQHLSKPGTEADLKFQPMCDAPYYKGSGKLHNMTAVITGGDSGIGRSVAILYAREGADVVIVYLSEHKDAAETKEWVEKEGRKCMTIAGDVTNPRFCEYVAAQTVKELGGIDILVNNAAFQLHTDNIEHLSDRHFDCTLKTNLYGYFYMVRASVPYMKSGGAIINN